MLCGFGRADLGLSDQVSDDRSQIVASAMRARLSWLLAEDAVHGLGALCDDRPELLAIDRLRHHCAAMADEAGDLLDGDTRV